MKFIKPSGRSALTDHELIDEYKRTREKQLIGDLFERYVHLVFGVCMKYLKDEDLCKDASMEIFEKLLTDLEKHEITYFKSWLYMVAKNYCLMYLRNQQSQRNKMQKLHYDESAVMESESNLHQEKMETEHKIEDLQEAIALLNAEQKTCIELFYLQEKCYQEIAETTGFSMMKVKSYIQNGKRNLKLLLLKKNEQRFA